MAFKFPFTNYHELNLTWVLDQLKSLFEKSEENVTVIENYNGRLTAVETELPLVEETARGASQTAANAASLAQTAKSAADTAQENAIQAQGLAGTARQEAQAAQAAADAATQAAQQAQAAAQNFDGRITQAENDASQALAASRSFENRVQSAITTANNAAQTATNAQGIATRADQNAALALDTLNAQRSELERIGREQAALISEETESGKTEIENLAQSVLDSIPSDYTALSNLVDKKAPVIINSASGAVASFNDGADNMKIQKLVVNIEPVQAGSGEPSPDNVRPISGWTGANIYNEETYNASATPKLTINWQSEAGTIYGGTVTLNEDGSADVVSDRAYALLNNPDLWEKSTGTQDFIYQYEFSDRKMYSSSYRGLICSAFSVDFTQSAYIRWRSLESYRVGIKNNTTAYTLSEIKAFSEAGKIAICYDLATPQTYRFDNIGQLYTFLGTNNIWADIGNVEVTYPADTKLYIDGKLAELQATILENI